MIKEYNKKRLEKIAKELYNENPNFIKGLANL